jgi:hypothetical protein
VYELALPGDPLPEGEENRALHDITEYSDDAILFVPVRDKDVKYKIFKAYGLTDWDLTRLKAFHDKQDSPAFKLGCVNRAIRCTKERVIPLYESKNHYA